MLGDDLVMQEQEWNRMNEKDFVKAKHLRYCLYDGISRANWGSLGSCISHLLVDVAVWKLVEPFTPNDAFSLYIDF